MSGLLERIRQARETGDFGVLVEAVPYARFLGISAENVSGELIGKLAYSEHLIGNPRLPALHGGTVGALLESTAIFKLMRDVETVDVPKIVNITVEYLRTGRPVDTFARGEIFRQGRRVAHVRAVAWQEDRDRPIAAANAHFLLGMSEEER